MHEIGQQNTKNSLAAGALPNTPLKWSPLLKLLGTPLTNYNYNATLSTTKLN